MAVQGKTPGNRQGGVNNPSDTDYERRFNEGNFEQRIAEAGNTEKGLRDLENFSRDNASGADKNIAEREQNAGNRITNNYTGAKKSKASGKFSFKSNKGKYGSLIAIAGSLGLVAAIFFAVLPLKLNMFVDNITKIASEVPGYAMERRTEYITTRLLAIHLMKKANGIANTDHDQTKAIFCKGASISCSLLATYGGDYFDKIIDVKMGERFGNNVRMTLTPIGVSSLGGQARSWTLDIERNLGDNQVLNTTKTLQSNAEAKAYVKNLVNKNLQTKNTATRFLARAILMKKYGITHWRAFEKTSNKLAENKTKVKTAVNKNTIGRVSSKLSLYFGCFSDPSVCQSLKDGLSNQAGNLQEQIDNESDQGKKDRLIKKKEALDKLAGNEPLSDEDLAGSATKSALVKKLLAVSGVAAGIGMIDMMMGAVGAIDDGALEIVSSDMAKTAYAGLGYGEETGLIPNMDKIKAGDGDLEIYGELTSLLDNAEQSPLMQYENGLISSSDVASNTYGRTCDVNGEQKTVTLPKGQLVCPERKLVRDYTSLLVTNPAWEALAGVAEIWNGSIGVIIDAIGDAASNLPIISQISSFISELSEPLMTWFLGLVFVPPETGFETSGENNYDALSGTIRDTQNLMMEEGVTEDGKAQGGGGSVLTSEQVAAISREVRADQQVDFENESLVARLFNPELSGSFAQKFVARVPTSFNGLLSLPQQSFASLFNTSSVSAYEATAVNPFGLPIYGYAVGDPTLEADPAGYTEPVCAESARIREESYGKDAARSPIPTYGASDSCALEKMTVGAMLQAAGVTDDPYSLVEPGSETTAAPGGVSNTGRPEGAVDRDRGWTLADGGDYTQYACDPRTPFHSTVTTQANNNRVRAKINLCELTPSRGNNANGSSLVASVISTNAKNMLEAAAAAGHNISLGDGMRIDGGSKSYFSQHGMGVSMDLDVRSGFPICSRGVPSWVTGWGSAAAAEAACRNIGGAEYAAYKWLQANAPNYGFQNLVVEPWHWSSSGT